MAAANSKINDSSQAARQAILLRTLSHWITGTHTPACGRVKARHHRFPCTIQIAFVLLTRSGAPKATILELLSKYLCQVRHKLQLA